MSRTLCLALLLAAAGCSPDYPMDKPGTWRITEGGSNDANLRAMLVQPRDLDEGVAETGSLAPLAVAPVRRLLTGRRQPLPAVSASRLTGSSLTPPAAPGGGQNVGE